MRRGFNVPQPWNALFLFAHAPIVKGLFDIGVQVSASELRVTIDDDIVDAFFAVKLAFQSEPEGECGNLHLPSILQNLLAGGL